MAAGVLVKIIGAVYKIPLTAYIGATGRGYFSTAFNIYLPIHALTMGAFPIALTKLVSTHNAKGEVRRTAALGRASKKLFLTVGLIGTAVMLLAAKPYSRLISGSPESVYTILTLAPSVFFSCMCGCHRAFAEGYLDMKPSAAAQIIEALFKLIFGLLFARLAMSELYNAYLITGRVLFTTAAGDGEALASIYPLTSAAAMLGSTLGSIVSWVFAAVYNRINYCFPACGKSESREALSELSGFAFPLVFATAVQSFSTFTDNASLQYCLSKCDAARLAEIYNVSADGVHTYVYGVYSSALDFRNLVPSIVMTLGITAVPAVSLAYEGGDGRFESIVNSVFRYTVMLSCIGGVFLCLFGDTMLGLFYGRSNPDIVQNAQSTVFILGATLLPCCVASTSVFCAQSLGFSKQTVIPFALSAAVRAAINLILVRIPSVNVQGAAVSNFIGFSIIFIINMLTISNRTKVRFSTCSVFVKPIICSCLVFFAVYELKQNVFKSATIMNGFLPNFVAFLLLFVTLMLLLNIISLNDLKNLN
jgi:stage V sporulation protein B